MHAISDDIGKLILRVAVAGFILVYGIQKILDPSQLSFIGNLFEGIGLPAFLAYLVYLGEVIAPLAMIIGWRTKIAAALVTITMAVVILLGHSGEIFPLSNFVWWGIELQTTYFFGAMAVMFLGAGKFAFSSNNRWD